MVNWPHCVPLGCKRSKKDMPPPDKSSKSSKKDNSENSKKRTSQLASDANQGAQSLAISTGSSKRRTRIPNKPNKPANLWTIMKNSIGKDLTKIPMPVNFSEPLSMLQRLTEDFEYSKLLDNAAQLKDMCHQMAIVALFTVSSYACTAIRVAKPFNPLLGETYECDRRNDLGWRLISEQVSHHPPAAALFCEGKKWKCWQEFTMSSKFRGKYLTITPLGISHLVFDSGSHYTWRKVNTNVNNIIFGKLWIDNYGDMEINNHTDGTKCVLSYLPNDQHNKDKQKCVKGTVKDKKGTLKWVIEGTWDKQLQIAPVNKDEVGEFTVAWVVTALPEGSSKYYNFSLLACQLNEPEKGVAPTDSRNRPDQRLMENGDWDQANKVKVDLEEKQRRARKEREAQGGKTYEPVWFKPEKDSLSGLTIHIYKGEYWECKQKGDWSKCPDIFL